MSSYSSQYSSQQKLKEAARIKPKARPLAGLALSTVLAQAPQTYDGRRITAVDRNVVAIGALPQQCAAQVKTLYLSKNSLASLEGIQQFGALKALSVADNQLAELDALCVLRAAGIRLEAASFEGNPIADLPNYRAHVLDMLGPSLQMLDNRAVTPEERQSAASAVAHEATMLALMLSNACLVHKLGKAVQLVRLHCELKCAVLGGQCGSGGSPHERSGGADASRFLQLWDYEGALNRQERNVVLLAIRREVGRRYKRMLLAGAKLDGSAKAWQQAFAQVMLAQQETIASLMQLLEDARAEAAAVLAPLTRPSSPMKLHALRSEREADCRVKHDREALITELRDAFLGLAEGSSGQSSPQRNTAKYEQRIRDLHTALQASSSDLSRQQHQEEAAAQDREWSIPSVRAPAHSAGPSPVASPGKPALARPKSALRQPASSPAHGRKPVETARPNSAGCRPTSAPAERTEGGKLTAHPRVPPQPAAGQRASGSMHHVPEAEQPVDQPGSPAAKARPGAWQAHDHLAAMEPEQHRIGTPTPFRHHSPGPGAGSSAEAQQRTVATPAQRRLTATGQSPHPASAQRPLQGPVPQGRSAASATAAEQTECLAPAALPAAMSPSRPSSLLGRPSPHHHASSSASSQHASPRPASLHPASPSTWMGNPLANGEGQRRPSSPAMQNLMGMLEHEGEKKQIDVLQSTAASLEVANTRLQEANTELADSLQQVHQHAQSLEAQLAQLQVESAAREQQLASEAEDAKTSKQELEAEVLLLRMDREGVLAQLAQQQADIDARVAKIDALRCKVEELEARDPIRLTLTVSYETELNAERVRSAAHDARATELAARLAGYQRMERLHLASDVLGGRSCLRRMFQSWRAAAAEQASSSRLGEVAAAAHRSRVLRTWMARWRLAVLRARMLQAREHQRQEALLRTAWASWRQYCHDLHMRKALEVAAQLHRQTAVLRLIIGAWNAHTVARRQVDWPADHPTMAKAAGLRRRRLQAAALQAWQAWLVGHAKPKLAQLKLVAAHVFLSTQRQAWCAWREYMAHRCHRALLKEVADQHLLSKHVQLWQQRVLQGKVERAEALRGAVSNKVLLLRRAWRAWWQFVRMQHAAQAAAAAAVQHRKQVVLRSAWWCWQEWGQLITDWKDRRRIRGLKAGFHRWRLATRAAEQRCCAAQFYERKMGVLWQQAFRAWRELVDSKQRRLQRLAHAQEVLLRWRLSRCLAIWRRGVLISKLQRSLELVQQLQAAIGRVKEELQHKAAEVATLESVKLTVETHAASLDLRVSSMDSELLAAETKASELQAALRQAQGECRAASAAKEEALAARDAAVCSSERAGAERDAAVATKGEALAEALQARGDRDAAQQHASVAEAGRDAAVQAQLAAEQLAAAAEEERTRLAAERDQQCAELQKLRGEREELETDLPTALAELQSLTNALDTLQQDHARLKQAHEEAVREGVRATADKLAASKQAERLAAMCEERERQCRELQATTQDLEAQVASLRALDEELRHIAERSDQLYAENRANHAKLQHMAGAVEQAESDRARLRTSLDAMKVEEAKLLEALDEQQKQRQELAGMVETLRTARQLLEGQLQGSQGLAEQHHADKQALSQVVARLQTECEGLLLVVDRVAAEKQGLEAQVAQLQKQLQQGNAALQSCRDMLVECTAGGNANPELALMDLLGCVKARLCEKDAALKSLAQDNCERAERMQALQRQVELLSVLADATADARCNLPAPGAGSTPPAGAASWSAPLPHSLPAATASKLMSPTFNAMPTASFGSAGSASASALPSSPLSRGRGGAPLPAGMPPSQPSSATARFGYSPSGTAGQPSPASHMPLSSTSGAGATPTPTAQDPTTPYFSSTFTPSAPTHPSPAAAGLSRLGLPAAPHLAPHGAVHRCGPPGSAADPAASSLLTASTAALNTMLRNDASARGIGPAAVTRGSASQYSSASSGSRMACSIQQLGSGQGVVSSAMAAAPTLHAPAGASPDRLRQLLRDPEGEAAARELPAEVSFLLELVVQKRVTAAEAQLVIKAAGEGDARPLLRVLDGAKRKIQGDVAGLGVQSDQPTLRLQRGGSGGQPSPTQRTSAQMSPGSASELAAVRRQIQTLQLAIQPH